MCPLNINIVYQLQEWAHQQFMAKHQQWASQQWGNFHYFRMQTIRSVHNFIFFVSFMFVFCYLMGYIKENEKMQASYCDACLV